MTPWTLRPDVWINNCPRSHRSKPQLSLIKEHSPGLFLHFKCAAKVFGDLGPYEMDIFIAVNELCSFQEVPWWNDYKHLNSQAVTGVHVRAHRKMYVHNNIQLQTNIPWLSPTTKWTERKSSFERFGKGTSHYCNHPYGFHSIISWNTQDYKYKYQRLNKSKHRDNHKQQSFSSFLQTLTATLSTNNTKQSNKQYSHSFWMDPPLASPFLSLISAQLRAHACDSLTSMKACFCFC